MAQVMDAADDSGRYPYIDLRIALESLYLRDFANEHSQEMRFRLTLFGAWHLAENAGDLDERRSIRKRKFRVNRDGV